VALLRKTQEGHRCAEAVGCGQAGEDYAGALENAAVGGWQGLFLPDKGKANPADNKTVTVPTKPGRDPTLVRLEQEALSATKPPPEIRERMAQLTRGAA
jgi:hypothetical protein